MSPEQMDKLLDNLIQKMVDEGQITIEEPSEQQASAPGVGNGKDSKVKFEVTDKSLDFLGFKTLKDLLGSLGKSSFGRHDTRDLATGIEASGSSQAVRVRRHAEPRHQRDAVLRHPPRGRQSAARHGVFATCTSTSASTRVPAPPC